MSAAWWNALCHAWWDAWLDAWDDIRLAMAGDYWPNDRAQDDYPDLREPHVDFGGGDG